MKMIRVLAFVWVTLAGSFLFAAANETESLLAEGRRLLTDKQIDAAKHCFEQILEIDPNNIDALLDRTEIWREKEQWNEMLKDVDKVIEIDPSNATAYRRRVYGMKKLGISPWDCVEYGRKAMNFAPDESRNLSNMLMVLLEAVWEADRDNDKEKHRACLPLLQETQIVLLHANISPTESEENLVDIRCLRIYSLAEIIAAANIFNENTIDSQLFQLYVNISEKLTFEKVIPFYRRLAGISDSDEARLLLFDAVIVDFEEWIGEPLFLPEEEYDKQCNSPPQKLAQAYYVRALSQRASLLQERAEYEKAEHDCRKAHAIMAENPETLHALGYLCYKQEKFDEALDYVSRYLSIVENDAEDSAFVDNFMNGLALRSEIHEALGNEEQAQLDHARCQEILDAFNSITEEGRAYMESGEYEKAIEILNNQLAIKPNDYEFLFMHAVASYNSGRYDDAMNDAEAIIKNGRGDETIHLFIVSILIHQKKYQEAIDRLTKMIEKNPEQISYYMERIICYRDTKEYERAEEDVAAVVRICAEQKSESRTEYSTSFFVDIGLTFLKEKQVRSAIGLLTLAKDFAAAREQKGTESELSQILAEINQQLDKDGQIKETNEFQTLIKRIRDLGDAMLSSPSPL